MSVQSEIDRITGNVASTYNALESVGADMPNTQNTDNLPETVLTIKAVLYAEQTLSKEQQAQARENIGAITADDLGGTVEITDGNPQSDKTVLTLNPNGDTVNIYTAEEIDAMGFLTLDTLPRYSGEVVL